MRRHNITRSLFGLISLALFLAVGNRNDALILKKGASFQEGDKVATDRKIPFQFEDVSQSIMPSFSLAEFLTAPANPSNSVLVGDVDANGWDDILIFYSPDGIHSTLRLYLNLRGEKFIDSTINYGLSAVASSGDVLGGGFADLDNDGLIDLVLSTDLGCSLYKGTGKKFVLPPKWRCPRMDGDGRSVNFFDHNNDGFLDIYFHSYLRKRIKPGEPNYAGILHLGPVRETGCGKNLLLKNKSGESFEITEQANSTRCTWASGAADFDGNGTTDLFLANDFGTDQMYQNRGGTLVESRDALGLLRSRLSMGADVGDVNNDGLPDIFVSNASAKPQLKRGFNSLWVNQSTAESIRFTDSAVSSGVDRCGFAWGAKFIDPNRDGRPDIFIANGPPRGRYLLFWPGVAHFNAATAALRTVIDNLWNSWRRYPSDGQLDCLFLASSHSNSNTPLFEDVASLAGLSARRVGMSIARLDFDRNGQEDLLIGNADGSPTLYRGRWMDTAAVPWVGVRLIGVQSNRDAIGSAIALTEQSGMLQARFIQPTNGLQGQDGLGQIVYLPSGFPPREAAVTWPSGKRQVITKLLRRNAYVTITEAP